jgi:uncharacterized protein
MDRTQIVRLTEEYGGDWEVQHARRILKLSALIGEGRNYSTDIVWVAAHLRNWGACPKFARAGVPRAVRSVEVAEPYLMESQCQAEWIPKILEAIAADVGDPRVTGLEAVLVAEADALDGLGLVGVLREFAMIPAKLRGAYSTPMNAGMRGAFERVVVRAENQPGLLRLERSRALALERVAHMRKLFRAFEEETFGYF